MVTMPAGNAMRNSFQSAEGSSSGKVNCPSAMRMVPLGSNFAMDPEILLQLMPAVFTSISIPMRGSRLVMIKEDSIGKVERDGLSKDEWVGWITNSVQS
jgi:hypothetical protein